MHAYSIPRELSRWLFQRLCDGIVIESAGEIHTLRKNKIVVKRKLSDVATRDIPAFVSGEHMFIWKTCKQEFAFIKR